MRARDGSCTWSTSSSSLDEENSITTNSDQSRASDRYHDTKNEFANATDEDNSSNEFVFDCVDNVGCQQPKSTTTTNGESYADHSSTSQQLVASTNRTQLLASLKLFVVIISSSVITLIALGNTLTW